MPRDKKVEVRVNDDEFTLDPDPLFTTDKDKSLTVKWVLAKGSDAFRFVCLYFLRTRTRR